MRAELERAKIEGFEKYERQKDEFQTLERKKNEYIDKLIE